MNFGAALLGLVAAFGVKVVVMVLAARFMLRLYRVQAGGHRKPWLLVPEDQRGRFRLLIWGLGLFCVSEAVCGIEVYILAGSNAYLTSTHALASATSAALSAMGVFQVLDAKYFHWTDRTRPCLAAKTCGGCTKRRGEPCTYRGVLLMAATLLAFMALPIFFASTARIDADPRPWVLPFESWNVWYDHTAMPWMRANFGDLVMDETAFFLPRAMLIIEFRVVPAAAMVLAATAIGLMLIRREDKAMLTMLAAAGTLSYAFFEVLVYGVTQDPFFGALAHEIGELFYLIMVAELLRRLFPAPVEVSAEQPSGLAASQS